MAATFLYMPPIRGLLGWMHSPPAISPMVWPISRIRWIRFATDRTGSSGVNGLILTSVPGMYMSGRSQDVVQCNRVGAVRALQDHAEQIGVVRNVDAHRGLHRFHSRKGVGDRTDTADAGRDLRHLFVGLADREFLNASDRRNGEPVTALDDPLIIDLQDELRMSLMSCGWGYLNNFRQLNLLMGIRCSTAGTGSERLAVYVGPVGRTDVRILLPVPAPHITFLCVIGGAVSVCQTARFLPKFRTETGPNPWACAARTAADGETRDRVKKGEFFMRGYERVFPFSSESSTTSSASVALRSA